MALFDTLKEDLKVFMKRHGITYVTFVEEVVDDDVKFLEIKLRVKSENVKKKLAFPGNISKLANNGADG